MTGGKNGTRKKTKWLQLALEARDSHWFCVNPYTFLPTNRHAIHTTIHQDNDLITLLLFSIKTPCLQFFFQVINEVVASIYGIIYASF